MAKVDPFVYPIPKEFLLGEEQRAYFEYLNRFLHDMWVRTGSGDDAIEMISVQETYPWSFDEAPESNVNSLFTPEATPESNVASLFQNNIDTNHGKLNAISVSTAYTAQPDDFINATEKAEISFPEFPCKGDVIVVRNGDGSAIKLSGNGRKINGSLTGTLRRESTAIEFYYFIDTNEWFAK